MSVTKSERVGAARIVREFCEHFVVNVPHARVISAATDVVWFEVDGEAIPFGPYQLVAQARAANAAERTRIYTATVESFRAARAR